MKGRREKERRTRRIIGFKESDFDAFVGEEAHFLSEVDGSMVWRCMPFILISASIPSIPLLSRALFLTLNLKMCEYDLPVHQEGNLISRHLDFGTNAELVSTPT